MAVLIGYVVAAFRGLGLALFCQHLAPRHLQGGVAGSISNNSSTYQLSPCLVHKKEGCLVQVLRTNGSHEHMSTTLTTLTEDLTNRR